MTTIRQNYQLISAILLVIGIVLITIAESPDLGWTRIFGATAISLGAVGLGVYLGLAHPGRWQSLKARLKPLTTAIGAVIVVLLFLPVLVALTGGVIGLFSDPEGTGWVMVVGTVILALMIAASIIGLIVALRSIVWAGELDAESGEQ